MSLQAKCVQQKVVEYFGPLEPPYLKVSCMLNFEPQGLEVLRTADLELAY